MLHFVTNPSKIVSGPCARQVRSPGKHLSSGTGFGAVSGRNNELGFVGSGLGFKASQGYVRLLYGLYTF